MKLQNRPVRIAADVGGTFTDVVIVDDVGHVATRKVPSTPPDFERGVLTAIELLLREHRIEPDAVSSVSHGTTVATNAVLERRGAKTALITTKGFRDVLELRRLRAPQIYDLFFDKPPILVDRYLRFEVNERISFDGEVIATVDEQELARILDTLQREAVESIAVCLLHSYAHPQHEQIVGSYLLRHLPNVPVSLSCEVLPQRREYERTATTAANAYVRQVMRRYLDAMQVGLHKLRIDSPLLIMQSAGGLTPAEDAASRPVYALESGPAAGVLAAAGAATLAKIRNVISFDMGGTTAKAAMIEEYQIPYSAEYELGSAISAGNRLAGGGGERIMAPSIDIAEVGAGGGSIAYLDAAGGLRVGPRSAGADPGPVCYQCGGEDPTVTDANVVLGYIKPGKLADGEVIINANAAHRAIESKIARPLGMGVIEAALGIHQIANAEMLRALREVSTHRGRDPREFTLVAFGGSGPVHAANLARELGTRRVMVPPMPGLFSAVGLLFSGIEHHDVRSCHLRGDQLTVEAIGASVDDMHEKMLKQFRAEAIDVNNLTFDVSLEMRYTGQVSQIRVPLECDELSTSALTHAGAAFAQEHQRLYGHSPEPSNSGSGTEVVAVRLVGRAEMEGGGPVRGVTSSNRPESTRAATFAAPWGMLDVPVVTRAALEKSVPGPLVIDEYDATVVVPPDAEAHLDRHDNVIMEMVDAHN